MAEIKFEVKNTELIEYKKKSMARKFISLYLKNGKIERSKTCQLCLNECKTEAHHTDYGRPIDVMWLCDKCHGLVHREDNVFNPKNIYQTPVNLFWDENESVTVSLTLPARNFIALKKYSDEKKTPLSKILRNCVLNSYPVQHNQLNFNFDMEENEELYARV